MCKDSCSADSDCLGGLFCNAGSCAIPATAIGAGTDASCAILNDGTVHCWGQASGFQPKLGNSNKPVALAGLPKPPSQIGLGAGFGCVLLSDTTVWCWGDDSVGELGNDKFDTSGTNSAPVEVGNLPAAVTALGVGGSHACGLLSNASVWCWGDNEDGELGNGSPTVGPPPGNSIPVQASIDALGNAVSLAIGGLTSYAVMSDGGIPSLAGWGDASAGQLGDVTTLPGELVSVATPNNAAVVTAAAGAQFICVIIPDGTVWCWGSNMSGSLGTGDTNGSEPDPGEVNLPTNAVSLSAGGTSACAILKNGTLWCWGEIESSLAPIQVTGFPGTAKQVAVGAAHACVLAGNGSVWCWGNDNMEGQLGNGSPAASLTPVQVVPW